MTEKYDASEYLNDLFSYLYETERVEVEFDGKFLHIFVDDKEYLIHWHDVKKEMWLSSPKSGAHHFIPSSKKSKMPLSQSYCSTRNPDCSLEELLVNELENLF